MSAPPNAAPAAPANAPAEVTLTLKDILEKGFTFDTLVGFGRNALETVAKDLFKRDAELNDERRTIGEYLKSGYKPLGKLLCAVEETFNADYLANVIPQGTTFVAYCEHVLGKKLESMGRGAQCKRVFSVLVRGQKLAESDYDNATTDWLTESVSKILELAQKKYGQEAYLEAPEIVNTLQILRVRPEKAARQLRDIKNSLTGRAEVSGGELTAGKAAELVNQILAATFNGIPGAYLVADWLTAHVDQAAPKDRELWKRTVATTNAFNPDTVDQWLAELEQCPATHPENGVPAVPAVPAKADLVPA